MAETNLTLALSSTTNPRAPIHYLNLDILVTIFEVNTNLHWSSHGCGNTDWVSGPRPLDMLRQASQVCQQWREIILGSASLWGMVIDLDLLVPNEKDYWTKEVMERTGKSALCVCGQLDGRKETSRNFYASFLNKNWERIKRLDATVTLGHLWGAQTWDFLFRPSPKLEVLKLRNRGSPWYPVFRSQPNFTPPMFADIAPALREFAVDEGPSNWRFLQAPWLSQLHSLVISSPSTFDAKEVLSALASIPSLEHLKLRSVKPWFGDQQNAPLYIPFLRTLTISKDFTTSLFFLKSITPTKGLALNLTMYEYDSISDQDIHSLCKEITRYMESFFNSAPFANSLLLEPGKHVFKIRGCRSSGEIESISNHSDFSVSVSGGSRASTSLPALGTPKLLGAIAACSFGHISKFEFLPTEARDNIQSLQHLKTLFSSLFSVDFLVTSTRGLELLFISSGSSADIFPLLRTIWFKVGGKTASFPADTNTLFMFLRWKTVVGRRVATVDISESVLSEKLLDWTCLDDIEGMKVILRRDKNGVEEYICGTGRPDRLNLRKRF